MLTVIPMKLKRVYIEISNVCNLKCAFCSDCNRPLRSLSFSEFQHMVKQIKPICEYVYLHVKGEPLLHPNFLQFMDFLEAEKMKVQLVTNGTFIQRYPTLLQYRCLRKISFSLHSIAYQSLSVMDYMLPLIEFAQMASHQENPYCEFRFWNQNQLDDKSKQCLNLLLQKHPLTETNKKSSYAWMNHVYVHFDHQFEWPSDASLDERFGTCHGAKHMIAILSNGDVVPCCLDDQGQMLLGNLFNESLEKILSSDRYQNIIKGFNQNQLIEPLCQKCSYRKRFD